MSRVGGILVWIGLAQLSYQVWLWFDIERWNSFNAITLMREFGMEKPFIPWAPLRGAIDTVMAAEISVALVIVGLLLVLARPVAAVISAINSARMMAQTRSEIRGH